MNLEDKNDDDVEKELSVFKETPRVAFRKKFLEKLSVGS